MEKRHQVSQESALIIYDALLHAESDHLYPESELQKKLSKLRSSLEVILTQWDCAQGTVCVCVSK